MPARNVVKVYAADGIYHIYNRGVEKRQIFLDNLDYHVFLHILKEALSDPTTLPAKKSLLQGPTLQWQRMPKNFYQQIDLFAYCLMPNHFHLLLKQKREHGIKELLQSIATRYSIYFNKKYKRVGPLFQSNYKATIVTEEPYLLHLTRYIHLNPSEHFTDLTKAFSSYADYLGKRTTPWLNPKFILAFFSPGTLPLLKKHHTYQDFVESYISDSASLLGDLVLEEE